MVGHWNEAHSGVGRGPQWLGEGHSGWMRDIKCWVGTTVVGMRGTLE